MKRYRFIIFIVALILAAPFARVFKGTVTALLNGFSGTGCLVTFGVAAALFAALFIVSAAKGWVSYAPVFRNACATLVSFAVFYSLIYLSLSFVPEDSMIAVFAGFPLLAALVFLPLFFHFRKKAANRASSSSVRLSAASKGIVRYDFKLLYGGMLSSLVLSAIAPVLGFPAVYTVLPFALVCLAMLLWRLVGFRFFLLAGFLSIELFILIFAVPSISSPQTGSFWRISALSLLYLSLITPLADLYCHKDSIA